MIYKWLPFVQAPQTGEIILAQHIALNAPITIYYNTRASEGYDWRSVIGEHFFKSHCFSQFMYILPEEATTSSTKKVMSFNNIKKLKKVNILKKNEKKA